MSARSEVRVIRTIDELEALAPEWAALSSAASTPLLDHDWFVSAAWALHRESDLRVITVWTRNVLAAVAPMVVDESRRYLTLLGSSLLHEPGAWLYGSDQALRELADAVVSQGYVIVLDRIPAGSPLCHMLPRLTRWQALSIRRRTANSFLVQTHLPWETYCATLSNRTRRRLASNRLRAERSYGPVRFERLTPAAADVDALLNRLVDVEGSGWKGRSGTALARRSHLLHFFRTYAIRAAAAGRLRVSTLWFGDVPAAVELGVEAYARMWGLKLGYDEQFAAFAPALQLVHASIEAAHRSGLSGYEFLGSAEDWQQRWRPSPCEHELTALYPFRPTALTTAFRDAAMHFARRAQQRPAS